MKRILTFLILFLVIITFLGNPVSQAQTFHSAVYGFSIEIPDDWSKRKPNNSWTLFTYAKLGSGENLNMNVQKAPGLHSIRQVLLEQIFHPFYKYVTIIEKNYDTISSIDYLRIIYKLKDSDVKRKIEGKNRLQYFVVQWIKSEKLFTVTFTDSENNFHRTIKSFIQIADSIKIDK